MLWVTCVEHGDYLGRGREYVAILRDMCTRSLRREHRFVCFTDAPERHEGVETRPLPGNLKGWWNKLYLFAPGQFPDGDRVIFLDLDTVVMGGMEKIAGYDGDFCILRDFYRPQGYGSGLMAWKAGFGAHIWQRFVDAGCPDIPGGDQAWIEQCVSNADTWQAKFPGRVVSYKAHCRGGVPDGAWIVCFHGKPRPHDCLDDPNVAPFWKIGGARLAEFEVSCNTAEDEVLANIRHSMSLDIPWIRPNMVDGHMVIVGGGPSLADTWRNLKRRRKMGQHIWAMNGAHDYLIERNVAPDACCLLDARVHTVDFVRKPHPDVTYFVGSQCHPDVFAALKDHKVYLWHGSLQSSAMALLKQEEARPACVIGGGNSVGLKSMFLGYTIGYRAFHLYGMDSSYRGAENHAWRQAVNDGERMVDVTVGGRTFRCARWMADQANSFKSQWRTLAEKGCEVTAHGDGLIPYIYRQIATQSRKAA